MRLSRALVLTAAAGSRAITPGAVAAALSQLVREAVFDDGFLQPGEAWQALFSADEADDLRSMRAGVAKALTGYEIDANVVPDDMAYRQKLLLAADMESTVIEQELINETAQLVGRRDEVERITAATMRGELPFETSLKERVALFAGLAVSELDAVFERVTLTPGAESLVRTMRANGGYTALVTGGFSIFADRIAERLGFHEVHANVLETAEGRLTGRVVEPVLGCAEKRGRLLAMCRQRGLDPLLSVAVGDGANDLDMLAAAGLGIAFRAKPKVQEAQRALESGAVITHGDLSAVLYLQGLRAS